MFRSNNLWVGFDNLFRELNESSTQKETYPPHNVVDVDENNIHIELAVAGFAESDLEVEYQKNLLTIRGDKKDAEDKTYSWKGISGRKFTKCFRLGSYLRPINSNYNNGILVIHLRQFIPEEEKPQKIEIGKQFLQD